MHIITLQQQQSLTHVRCCYIQVRELLKNLTEMNSDGARWDTLEPDEDGQIDLEYVLCTKCGTSDTTDENDLVLCDNTGCFRAYHQECLEPHVSSDVFEEDEDSDWFCWQCECIADCLEMLDDEFEGCYFEKWQVSQSVFIPTITLKNQVYIADAHITSDTLSMYRCVICCV
jgi:PHD-finger